MDILTPILPHVPFTLITIKHPPGGHHMNMMTHIRGPMKWKLINRRRKLPVPPQQSTAEKGDGTQLRHPHHIPGAQIMALMNMSITLLPPLNLF